ncbi:MAG: hypothetical protein CMH30_08025 [Micavibrio sp.]|nr:hypothetical protein [Micavibrio sp.]|tara:strand:+ start:2448 stop:3581 length:1134 start_codon:yes stop_codon:yes gene_type:complete
MYLDNNLSKEFDSFLVQLHDSERVLELAKERKSPTAVAALADVIAVAMQADLTVTEAELAADILVDLTKKLEIQIRAGLALRLSALERLPLRLALHIANDVPEVAKAFLENTPVLGDMDLFYIIQGQGSEHWQAIAKRQNLSDKVINLLVEKEDALTSENILNNEHIALPERSIEMLMDFVQQNTALMVQFAKRGEVSEKLLLELYWKVNAEQRAVITDLVGLDLSANVIDEQLQDIGVDFTNVTFGQLNVTKDMQATARKMKESGSLDVKKMSYALKNDQLGLFYAMFAEFSEIPLGQLDEIFREDQSKVFPVVAKALGLDRSTFVCFLLQTRKLRNNGLLIDHSHLYKAIQLFNSVTVEMADTLMKQLTSAAQTA